MADFEKLGMFYLGRRYDLEKKQLSDELLMYDSKDMVTHGVCVGMTGSGKTGLCITLLEEAAIDNIPALIIDPKGDMTNLLLSFPELQANEFLPWINTDDAQRAGLSPEEFAKNQAELWTKGLSQWGQDGQRIKKLKESADFTIYTPGSTAGIPVSILNSFACPPPEVLEDREALGDLISANTTGLLGLVGIAADPIKSREHILISNIIHHYWNNERDLDLASLITAIQKPPFDRVGAFAVDSFYPQKERFELALTLNNLLAAPGFSTWLEGEALDVNNFLYTAAGKPRHSIFYIAHLNDSERMFFVTLLLNQVIAWMRSQPGTTSLRALVYMDEVAGYLPPVAMPPSKKPLMLLFKQARAFGVGVLLATQNPVDLDYKALSNAGTWFIGRLQTQQDIDRIVEGLKNSSANLDASLTKAIAGLGKRIFLMKNIHEDRPEIFQTRWALSYLRGPLTLAQIKTLSKDKKGGQFVAATAFPKGDSSRGQERPNLPPQIKEYFAPLRGVRKAEAKIFYKPVLFGVADVHFPGGVAQHHAYLAPITDAAVAVDWDSAIATHVTETEILKDAEPGAYFDQLAAAAFKPENYKIWEKNFNDMLFRTAKLEIYRNVMLKETSLPNETEREFRIRLSQKAREVRDREIEILRKKYATKMQSLEERILRAQQRLEKERSDYASQNIQTAVSVGATLLSALMGRKALSRTNLGRATTAMRSGVRSAKERSDIAHAEENLNLLRQQLSELENELNLEIERIELKTDPLKHELETQTVRPKKTDIFVRLMVLLWLPHFKYPDNKIVPCYE